MLVFLSFSSIKSCNSFYFATDFLFSFIFSFPTCLNLLPGYCFINKYLLILFFPCQRPLLTACLAWHAQHRFFTFAKLLEAKFSVIIFVCEMTLLLLLPILCVCSIQKLYICINKRPKHTDTHTIKQFSNSHHHQQHRHLC